MEGIVPPFFIMGKTVIVKNGALIKDYFAFYQIPSLVKDELFSALASDGIEQVIIDLDSKWGPSYSLCICIGFFWSFL